MNPPNLNQIRNYYRVSDRLSCSGQPTREQFAEIARAGYEVVINLALPTSDSALADEGAIVTGLGMSYFHLPVLWESPTLEDLELFFGVTKATGDRPVWIHCALNMRASCFLYLYRKHIVGLPEEEARYPMDALWRPEGVWADLIEIAGNRWS